MYMSGRQKSAPGERPSESMPVRGAFQAKTMSA
jgi:hypothetical protein